MEEEFLDKRTDKRISDIETIASVYGNDGIQYFIDEEGKIYIKDENEKKVLVKDETKISQILNLFNPSKTDVI